MRTVRYECCVVCWLVADTYSLKGWCTKCYQKEYRKTHKEKIARSKHDWYIAHPEFSKDQREKRHFSSMRQTVLTRDGNRCVECGSTSGLIVHHKNGDGRGSKTPDNHPDNLVTWCRACHAKHHSTNARWSRNYDCCVTCGRTDRKHNAKGMCWSCYLKKQYQNKNSSS